MILITMLVAVSWAAEEGTEPDTDAASDPSAAAAAGGEAAESDDTNTGLLFDLNVAAPILSLSTVNVIGDGLLGYQTAGAGAALTGSFDAYGQIASVGSTTSYRRGMNLDLWKMSGTGGERWEIRPTVGYWRYRSARTGLGGNLTRFVERSTMIRTNVMIGYRRETPGKPGISFWAGGGGQIEGYLSRNVKLSELSADGSAQLTVTGDASYRLRILAPVGDPLLVRIESDGVYFSITKDTATLSLDESFQGTFNSTRARQLDLNNTLYVDWLGGSFLGFVPMLTVGLDLYSTATDDLAPVSTVVPSAGIGLRQTAL